MYDIGYYWAKFITQGDVEVCYFDGNKFKDMEGLILNMNYYNIIKKIHKSIGEE